MQPRKDKFLIKLLCTECWSSLSVQCKLLLLPGKVPFPFGRNFLERLNFLTKIKQRNAPAHDSSRNSIVTAQWLVEGCFPANSLSLSPSTVHNMDQLLYYQESLMTSCGRSPHILWTQSALPFEKWHHGVCQKGMSSKVGGFLVNDHPGHSLVFGSYFKKMMTFSDCRRLK